MLQELVALILFIGVIAYAVFGGADFGVGFWDLTAGGARKGGGMRALIDRSIGPVWEANHVWLIFVLVYLWSGFPTAFASIVETLWVPFSLAGLGIVLRGAAFAFRKFSPTLAHARFYGVLFAVSSVITPFFFGTIAGALAAGRVPATGVGGAWTSWTGPTSIVGGALAVLTCAFVAAVFLTVEAARDGNDTLVQACRLRALGAAVVAGVAALGLLPPLSGDAPRVFDSLTGGRALPLVVASAAAGTATLYALWTKHFRIARFTAPSAVAAVVLGWGVAQYPMLSTDAFTIKGAAGANATLWGLILVSALAAVTVVPSLVYLYVVTQRPTWMESQH